MTSYSKRLNLNLNIKASLKLISTSLVIILFLCIVNIVILNRLVDNFASSIIPQIIKEIKNDIGQQISITKAGFSLSSGFYIRDIILGNQEDYLITIKEAQFRMSLFSLLKREIKINKIVILAAESSIRAMQNKDEIIPRLVKFLRTSPKSGGFKIIVKPFKILIKDLKIDLDNKNSTEEDKRGFFVLNTNLYYRDKNLICDGNIDLSNLNINPAIMKYSPINMSGKYVSFYIDVVPFEDNLFINNSRILVENIKLIGSGIIYNFRKEPYLDIKLISNPLNFNEIIRLKPKYYIFGLLNLTSKLYGRIKSLKLDTEIILLNSYLYSLKNIFRIGDISSNICLGKNGINIKEFTAVIDDRFPFLLSGRIKNLFEPEFDIEIRSILKKSPILSITESYDLNLTLNIKRIKRLLSGELNLLFIRNGEYDKKNYQRKFEAKFDNLAFDIYSHNTDDRENEHNFLKVYAEKLEILEKSMSENEPIIKEIFEFNNFEGDIVIDPGFWTIRNLICRGYDGEIRSYGNFDFTKKPVIYNFALVLNNIAIDKLRRFYPLNFNLTGKMNGRLIFQNKEPGYIKGNIEIDNAQLDNLEPLNQSADFLNINSIKHIKQANILTEFNLDKDGLYINKFDLSTQGIIFKSRFNINKEKWLDGRISLSLLRSFLEESDKFRLLLNIAQEKNSMIDFYFRVAGFPGSLRIQLLESEFRNKLMEKLSSNIQEKIEAEINKVIDSLQAEN